MDNSFNLNVSDMSFMNALSNVDDNETPYLSLLEHTYNNLTEEKVMLDSEESHGPLISTINESNQKYNLQSAQNDQVNIKKYVQYKKPNGEALPILETHCILPSEGVMNQCNQSNQDNDNNGHIHSFEEYEDMDNNVVVDEGSSHQALIKKEDGIFNNKASVAIVANSNLEIPPKIYHIQEKPIKNSQNPPNFWKDKKPIIKDLKVEEKLHLEYKHKCEICKSAFINRFLLSRHHCAPQLRQVFTCPTCHLTLLNLQSFNIHKKVHSKPCTIKTKRDSLLPVSVNITQKCRIPTITETSTGNQSTGTISRNLGVASTPSSTSRRQLEPQLQTPLENKECEKCPKTFNTNDLLKDQLKHVGGNKQPRSAHTGIRGVHNRKFARNIHNLKEKIQQLQL